LARNPDRYRDRGGYMAPNWQEVSTAYALPYLPFSVQGPSERDIYLTPVPTVAEASARWQANGSDWVQALERERANVSRSSSGWQLASGFLAVSFLHGLAKIAQLSLINALILAIQNRRRKRRAARDPFLA
jgi:hypothetical protein